jgi:hypothetical protein
MMSATFGREMAQSHFQQLLEEAENDRLVGCLKRQRRDRRERAQAVRRKPAPTVCAQDVG